MNQYKLPENWAELPVEEVLMGGIKKKIKYDKEINTVYLLNDRGEWTGEKAHPPVRTNTAPANQTAANGQATASNETEQVPVVTRTKPQKSKWTPILIVIIVILSALLLFQNSGLGSNPKSYSVIIAMQNIQPGETIEGKLASLTISADEYHQYAATGGLYNSNDYSSIKQYVATSFIPKDGYVTYSNVGVSFQAANPWTIAGTATTISIPVDITKDDLKEVLWGNKVTITVTTEREIKMEEYPDAYRPSSPEVIGNTTLQTIQIDTYELTDITIIDVLNSKEKSLYSTYAGLAAIPELYQADCLAAKYESEKQRQTDTPAYIKIAVSKETADWWKQLTNKKYTISVSLKVTGADCATTLQNDTYLALKNLIPAIQTAWDAASE